MLFRCSPFFVFVFGVIFNGCQSEYSTVDFNYQIKPILSDRCFSCHGPDKAQRKADLRLDTEEGLLHQSLSNGKNAFNPYQPNQSEAFLRMISADPNEQMPPPDSKLSLTKGEIALIRKWINEGAVYKPHWAFIPPVLPDLPKVKQKNWRQNPIDDFILEKLAENQLVPAEKADKETLLRRLYLDLTGLPPDMAAMDAFLADNAPDSYERVVDSLLASIAFAERIATDWLDLARYADTHGYTVDRYRDMSPWRDWIIQAFHNNQPYDEFVTWQLAGDLLPNPTREQLMATAFNRNHPQNAEGGIVNEEFRSEYAANRTETFGTAFLGMTLNCSRCHDHKYDPIEQKEFYSLYSFFNNVDESGQITWSNYDVSGPTLLLPDEEVQAQLDFLQQQVDQAEENLDKAVRNASQSFNRRGKAETVKGLPTGAKGFFSLENTTNTFIPNLADAKKPGKVLDPVDNIISATPVVLKKGFTGNGVQLNGDDALAFPGVGRFDRAQPFSVGLWVYFPENLHDGVIFHSNKGGIIYNFKGYQVSLEKDTLDVRLAHVFPSNALHLTALSPVPKNKWVQITLTYDGSSRAKGVDLYLDGIPVALTIKRDQLSKDIVFIRDGVETYLKVGARWRSKGLNQALVDEILVYDRKLSTHEIRALAGNNSPVSSAEQKAMDEAHFIWRQDPAVNKVYKDLTELRRKYNQVVENVQELMIVQEMPKPRPTFVLERGQYDSPKERVVPGTPKSIFPFPADLPQNRLGLAKWLFMKENPLTARVAVNHWWQMIFGKGLVVTSEDFGNQGQLPTHPELLDWLAVTFRESGWDIKALIKLMVMSATYQQSSKVTEAVRAIDPENKWLSHSQKARLSAEMLRDNALAASGLLVNKVGGPSVFPYQPDGLWKINSGNYVQSHGENLYRRSMYTVWKRTVPPPTMNIFDAPDRSYCVVRRQKTLTPLQALTLMNDPQLVEAARVLAQIALKERKDHIYRLEFIFRKLTGVKVKPRELKVLEDLFHSSFTKYKNDLDTSRKLLAVGEYPVEDNQDPATLAAYMVVASTVMNYESTVFKK